MTRHLLFTGISVLTFGYKTSRDVRWFVRRRLERA
jgi:hypothetical protein